MATDLKAEEITEIIRQQLTGIGKGIDVAEVGSVVSVGDGIARVYGLDKVMAGELLEFPHDVFGLALNLEGTTSAASSWAGRRSSKKEKPSSGRAGSSPWRAVKPPSAASGARWASRSTARAPSRPRSSTRWSASRPASSSASP